MLPNYGLDPERGAVRLGAPPLALDAATCPCSTIKMDWAWRKWDHLYGTYTYHGAAGLRLRLDARPAQPLDTFGRNLYVDTLDSAYGPGWKRENSFLTHKGTGVFCYSVNPHGAASGRQRRDATARRSSARA